MVKDEVPTDSADINDEDANRLLDSYQRTSSNFQRSFSILLGFALIFLFIFLLPYISSLDKSNVINDRIARLDANITKHSNDLLLLNSAEKGLKNLSSALNDFPLLLDSTFVKIKLEQITFENNKFTINAHKFLNQPQSQDKLNSFSKLMTDISKEISSITNYTTPIAKKFDMCNKLNYSLRDYCVQIQKIDDQNNRFINTYKIKYGTQNSTYVFPTCTSKFEIGTNEWAGCNLREKIQSELERMSQVLIQNVSSPLHSIDNISYLSELEILQKGIHDLKNRSYQTNSKTLFANESGKQQLKNLANQIKIFRETYNQTIEPTRAKFHNEIIKQEIEQSSQSKNFNLTKNLLLMEREISLSDKNKLEYRLNQTEFPFGKIPINLDESVAAFPVALGIGFLISAAYLGNSIKLRNELHLWYKSKYKEASKRILNQRIELIAPLWVDPSNSQKTQIMKFIIFMIPLIIFALSIILISNYVLFRQENQILTTLFSYGTFLNPLVYLGIYLVCLSFFVYGTLITLIAIKRYTASTYQNQ